MALDPQTKLILDALPPDLFDLEKQSPLELRALYQSQAQLPGEPVASLVDRSFPGPGGEVPVRVYAAEGPARRAGIVFFHGGGWVIGNIDTHDATVRKLANASGCVIVSVDYRLAPEHPFPAAAEDCYAALAWVAANGPTLGIDPARLAVAGDSAGGNLAAVVALMARDRGGPELGAQGLIYPVIDADFGRPSYEENRDGYMLTRGVMRWFWDQYAPAGVDRRDPYLAPIAAPTLAGLPPALVVTAEYDPLRDEGEAYARALEAAGVPTILTRYDGQIHGFVSFHALVEAGLRGVTQVADFLRARLD